LVKRVVFEDVLKAFTMERHISSSLQADCNSCIGIYCSNEGQNLNLTVHAINPKTLDEIKIDRSYSEGSSIRAFSDEVLSELYSLEIEKFIH